MRICSRIDWEFVGVALYMNIPVLILFGFLIFIELAMTP